MIWRLVAESFRFRPGRTAFLLGGYGLGVGVTIALLSIGGALLEQSRDRDLLGGGDLLVLPAGLDLETFRTGGLSSLYFDIEQAPFLYREVLTSPRFETTIAAAAPWVENELVYLRVGGDWVSAAADGSLPAASRALGVEPRLVAGTWSETARDRRWTQPGDSALYASIDAFHAPPAAVAGDSTWAEWHYFNVLLPEGWLYLTYMIAGDIGSGRGGGRMLAARVRGSEDRAYEALFPPDQVDFAPGRPDLRIGSSTVEIDANGVYRLVAEIPSASGAPLVLELELAAAGSPRYLPPVDLGGSDFASGYVVPLLDARANGRVCRGTVCETVHDAPAYHDHNWGVWREVTWEWGQANLEPGISLLYGGIARAGSAVGTGFAYLFDADGFAAVLPLAELEWTWSDAADGRRPDRLELVAARGADTLRLDMRVSHARATPAAEGPGDAQSVFHQLRGRATAQIRLGGELRRAEGEGFFETWSSRAPK